MFVSCLFGRLYNKKLEDSKVFQPDKDNRYDATSASPTTK